VSQYDDREAWTRLVVSRLATDAWRRLSRWRKVWRLSQPCEHNVVGGPSEQSVMLTRALAGLPHSQRQAITMHYLMDLPVADIAAELGAPANTVKSWLARGRTALAAALRDAPDYPDRTVEPKLAVSPLGCEP
jgi:RNA polymerase sigma-70 factor (ECF subfamily)